MEQPTIKFDELVEARKQEMESVLPGFITKVELGKHSTIVSSPTVAERSGYRHK